MKKIDLAVQKYDMLSGAERVLCALSGGADSVALTHYLAKNAHRLDITVAAAHFSHGIRKGDAQAECELCEKLCASLGIELFCGAGDTPEYAAAHNMGLEQAARELRYAFLEDAARRFEADRIATAHHARDNAETVIMNVRRGAYLAGLCGIPPRRDNLIRPLILTDRAEIEEYIAENQLEYASDATNFEPCCLRNRIRLSLLPQMEVEYPASVELLGRFSELARNTNAQITCKAESLVSTCKIKRNQVFIDAEVVRAENFTVAARAIELLYRRAGGKRMLSSAHIAAVYRVACAGSPSAAADVPDMRVSRRYDMLVFGESPAPSCTPQSLDIGETVRFGEWEITLSEGAGKGWVFDKKRLSFPLCVRPRAIGDSFFCDGYTKTLKKLMIERKIPREMRDNLPVLCDNEKIIAVALLGCDKRLASECGAPAVTLYIRRVEI